MPAPIALTLDEITITAPVTAQLLSGYTTEVDPDTYPVLHDRSLQPTDDDLIAIDLHPDTDEPESLSWGRAAFISVNDLGQPRDAFASFGAVLKDMEN